jgi:hypothetical protein
VLARCKLENGELSVLPATGDIITRRAVDTMIDFFDRHPNES